MMDNEMMEEKLWNFIDGNSDAGEKAFVEKQVREHLEWKQKYNELLGVHQLMKGIDLEEPSLRFTKNVMDEISRLYIAPATRKYLNKNIIWGIGWFFILSITGLVAYTLGQVDWSQPSNLPMPNLSRARNEIGFFYNNTFLNIFVMINILLGLMMLDMYLTKKKKEAA